MPRAVERAHAHAWALGAAAATFTAAQGLFLSVQPFNRHIPATLTVYSLLCAGIAGLAVGLRRWTPDTERRAFGLQAGIVLVSALVMRAMLFTTAPTLSDDVYRYLWDGRVQNAGLNPYLYPPSSQELEF